MRRWPIGGNASSRRQGGRAQGREPAAVRGHDFHRQKRWRRGKKWVGLLEIRVAKIATGYFREKYGNPSGLDKLTIFDKFGA